MEIAHRLEGAETLELRREQNDERDGELEESVIQKSRTESSASRGFGLRSLICFDLSLASKVIKDEEWGDYSQPFVPGPRGQMVEVARVGGGPPGFGRGLEEPG